MCMSNYRAPVPPPMPAPAPQAPRPAEREYHFFERPTDFGGTLRSRAYGAKGAAKGRLGSPAAQTATRLKGGSFGRSGGSSSGGFAGNMRSLVRKAATQIGTRVGKA